MQVISPQEMVLRRTNSQKDVDTTTTILNASNLRYTFIHFTYYHNLHFLILWNKLIAIYM